jgi:alpha-galactosidase
MSIWCIAASPLMIGCDVRQMETETAALLTNREVLAINQDSLGVPGRRVKTFGRCEIWQKPLSDGGTVANATAVALLNRGSSGQDITLQAGDIGLLDHPKLVRDLWAQEDTADFTTQLTRRVEPHQTILLKITQ